MLSHRTHGSMLVAMGFGVTRLRSDAFDVI